MNQEMAGEIKRVTKVIGEEGKTSQRLALSAARGDWVAMSESANSLIGCLVWLANEMARVIGAVSKGDLVQTMALESEGRPLKGEFLRMDKGIHEMVAQLGSFAPDVTRVATEVGSEGKLGGQAKVKGVSGTWKDLPESVNSMASNLTGQVRNLAEVSIAVAGEFTVLAIDSDEAAAGILISRLPMGILTANQSCEKPFRLSLSVGMSFFIPAPQVSLEELITRADAEMAIQKAAQKAAR
jgi:hypothetical protein